MKALDDTVIDGHAAVLEESGQRKTLIRQLGQRPAEPGRWGHIIFDGLRPLQHLGKDGCTPLVAESKPRVRRKLAALALNPVQHLVCVEGESCSAGARIQRLHLPWTGWQGFDPTNGVLVNQDHVVVACGRNYGDATPTSGTLYKGGGKEDLRVDVKVEEVEPAH